MEKIGSIQVLRACAVTLVVACHSFSRFAVGGFGVDIFFVVSGFIIATISPGQSPGEFLSRRFWRIYPVYWLLMLPLLFTAPIEWSRFAASLTLWPVWGGSLQSPYLPVAWTLYCEVLFYGATALAMVNWRAPLIIFGLAMFIDGITANPVAAHLGNPMVFEFLAGVALTRVARQPLSAALGLIVAAGLLGFAPSDNIIGPEVLSGSGGFERLFWWGMPAALIAYAALTFDAVLSRARWAVKLGDASYAIYLVFAPITSWLATFDERVAFVTALAVGIATHYFIERPILSMRPRLRLPEVQR